MFEKRATTGVPVHDLIALRWSGRAYEASRPVPRADLQALFEAARWAPSCFGEQPWRFLALDRVAAPERWQSAFACLAEANQTWAGAAPVLVVVCADSQFERDGTPNRWAEYDTGAAAMSLCVEATARGLMVHQMGGFDADRLRLACAIPSRYVPMSVVTVGYQSARDLIPAALRAREEAARTRKARGDLFFDGEWGRGC